MVIDLSPNQASSAGAGCSVGTTKYFAGHDKRVGVFASIQGEVVLVLLNVKANDRVKPSRDTASQGHVRASPSMA